MLHKLFVCEFITGGGFASADLPKKLAKEGEMMRDALIADLLDVKNCQIFTTYDARTPIDLPEVNSICVNENDDCWQVWASQIAQCHAVWAIAPETDGLLQKFAALTLRLGKIWLGCSPEAIELCGNKLKTAEFLREHGAAIPTFTLTDFLKHDAKVLWENKNQYICKPIFGAGCEDTCLFSSHDTLVKFMQNGREKTHLIQDYLDGEAASFNMLCVNGKSWLLSCNAQKIDIQDSQLNFKGVIVNDCAEHLPMFTQVADFIAENLKGLDGFVGVDIIFDEKIMHIIEINPRLTTSYVGLRKSIEQNPVQLYFDAMQSDAFVMPTLAKKVVKINV